jgi:NADP-dependent 3-hydroxy acid dehydrogenase YdfG
MSVRTDYYRDTVAAVTGAASGVGAALTELLLFNGARRVVLADVSEERLGHWSAVSV